MNPGTDAGAKLYIDFNPVAYKDIQAVVFYIGDNNDRSKLLRGGRVEFFNENGEVIHQQSIGNSTIIDYEDGRFIGIVLYLGADRSGINTFNIVSSAASVDRRFGWSEAFKIKLPNITQDALFDNQFVFQVYDISNPDDT